MRPARIAQRYAQRGRTRDRLASKGAVDITQVDQAMYDPELGFAISKGGREQLGQQEAAYGTAEKAYGEAKGKLSSIEEKFRGDLDKEWNKAQTGYSEVRVYDGNNLQGTYKVPKSVIDKLNTEVFNKGEGSYTGNWKSDTGAYNVDVTMRGTDEKYGKELHGMMGQVTGQVKSAFFEKVGPKVREANKELYSKLGEQRSALESEYAPVAGAAARLKESKETAQKEYKPKLQKRAALFSGYTKGKRRGEL